MFFIVRIVDQVALSCCWCEFPLKPVDAGVQWSVN